MLTVETAWLVCSIIISKDVETTKTVLREIRKKEGTKYFDPSSYSPFLWKAFCFYRANYSMMDMDFGDARYKQD